jgi:sugar phosphate isomerase/epimerase
MLRLSVNELSTIKWNFEEDVIHYHEAGFSAIGIWYPKLHAYGEEKGAELLREYNFSISSLTCACDFTCGGGKSFYQNIVQALDVVQAAADIGAKTLVVMVGGRNGHTRNHAKRIIVCALKELAEAGLAVGVNLAIEPLHSGCGRDTCLHTIPECLDLIQQVDSPNLGIAFDCYHLGQDSAVLDWMAHATRFIQLVQLGDAKHAPMGRQNRCLLGHGRIPLLELLQLLHQQGYSGFHEIELSGAGVEHLDYRELLAESSRTVGLWQLQELMPRTSLKQMR